MVLDDKGAVKAERLGLDIVRDPLAETLAAVGQFRAGDRPPRLGAAEKSKPHFFLRSEWRVRRCWMIVTPATAGDPGQPVSTSSAAQRSLSRRNVRRSSHQ